MIDGAGQYLTFARIILPLSQTALVTLAVSTFISTWNDYMWPLIVGKAGKHENAHGSARDFPVAGSAGTAGLGRAHGGNRPRDDPGGWSFSRSSARRSSTQSDFPGSADPQGIRRDADYISIEGETYAEKKQGVYRLRSCGARARRDLVRQGKGSGEVRQGTGDDQVHPLGLGGRFRPISRRRTTLWRRIPTSRSR